MEYYTLKTGEDPITTAIYNNRINQKLFLEEFLGLKEFGDSNKVIKTCFNTDIAKGYLRYCTVIMALILNFSGIIYIGMSLIV